MEMNKELLQAIRNAKSAAKRDGYDQLLYLAKDGTYTITRLYSGTAEGLWDMKEMVGFAVYNFKTETANYYSLRNRTEKAKSICNTLIKSYKLQ